MTERRVAASVLLTRGRGEDVEVYLVERSKRLRFFGGYLALPGGVLDATDQAGGTLDAGLRSCALRELFEETGVLLEPLSRVIEDGRRDALREALLRDEATAAWNEIVQHCPAALEAVEPLCRMTTPEFAPVRYETWFFHAELPFNEWPAIVPGELVEGSFIHSGAALDRWRRGELLIAPPVLLLLEHLDREGPAGFYEAVARHAGEMENGSLHPVYFSPGVLLAALRSPTLPPATTTNTYLVGTDRIWIVDPATPDEDEQARLFELLDRWVADGKKLEGILATHHHEDHVGAIVPVSRRYDLPVFAHALTLERLPGGFVRGEAIDDGARIELGQTPDGQDGWHLRTIHTPGHDQGHLAFVDSRYGSAIVGDLCSTVSTIVIDPPEGHMATYLQSLRRMLDESIQMLYPAHGPAHRDGPALLRQYLAHREDRESATLSALTDGARSIEELLPVVYEDTDPDVWPLAARSLLAGLQKLAEDGRVSVDRDERWQLR